MIFKGNQDYQELKHDLTNIHRVYLKKSKEEYIQLIHS